MITYFKENFPYLSDKEAELLSEYSEVVDYEQMEVIMEFGKYERYFYFLIDGLARGYNYTSEGEEYNLFFTEPQNAIMSPDKFFNDDRKLNTFVFETIIPAKAIKFDHDKLLELASQNSGIFTFYHNNLRDITQRLYERIRLLLIENAEERYLFMLNTRPQVVEHAQKRHLAQFLGITPNSFSRILRKFKEK